MAKITKKQVKEIVKRFEEGETPNDMAEEYGVHSSTIRRHLRSQGISLAKVAQITDIDDKTKVALRNLLKKNGVEDIEKIMRELENDFYITKKEKELGEEFEIINVELV